MASFLLQQLRRDHLVNKKREQPSNLVDMFTLTKAKPIDKMFG